MRRRGGARGSEKPQLGLLLHAARVYSSIYPIPYTLGPPDAPAGRRARQREAAAGAAASCGARVVLPYTLYPIP